MSQYTTEQVKAFVDTIKRNVDLFDRGIQDHINGEAVLVLGSTGAGKSTIMNMIANKQIKVFKGGGAFRVDVADKDYAGVIKSEGFIPMQIGHKADAETEFPNYVMVEGKQFWDCPGFGDTRGPEVDISNMYYVHNILHHAAEAGKGGVKFIVVQDNAGTHTGGGKAFRESVKTICKMFPSKTPQELINATTFVFTKVPTGEEQCTAYLLDLLDRVTPEVVQKDDQRVIEFLNTMRIEIDSIKHAEVPEVDIKQDLGNIDYIIAPVREMVGKVCADDAVIQNCNSGLVVSTDAHIVVLELQQFWQAEIYKKCQNLIPLIKNIFEKIEQAQGKEEVHTKIMDLLTALKADKEQIQHGGATQISLELLQKLSELSSDLDYQKALKDIKDIQCN